MPLADVRLVGLQGVRSVRAVVCRLWLFASYLTYACDINDTEHDKRLEDRYLLALMFKCLLGKFQVHNEIDCDEFHAGWLPQKTGLYLSVRNNRNASEEGD